MSWLFQEKKRVLSKISFEHLTLFISFKVLSMFKETGKTELMVLLAAGGHMGQREGQGGWRMFSLLMWDSG